MFFDNIFLLIIIAKKVNIFIELKLLSSLIVL